LTEKDSVLLTRPEEREYYSLDYKFTGLAVMIHNYEFTNPENKDVYEKDIKSFEILKKFKFQIDNVYINQEKEQISKIIAKYTSSSFDYSDYACILFCLVSYGGKNTMLSTDEHYVDIQENIIEPLCKVDSLKNKPKIFLCDCFWGNTIKFETLSDFFFVFAAAKNFADYSKKYDSYLISTFFEVLDKHGKTEDWDGLQKEVVRLMEKRQYQVPIYITNAKCKLAFVKNLGENEQQVFD
jgi:hypothetical protein